MSELLKALDTNGEFERDLYFTLAYNALASSLVLEISLEATKDNMNQVLELMNLSNNSFELIFKNWTTEDSSNANFDNDFPYQMLFKSLKKRGVIWISLDNDTLFVEFLYDCKDSALETFIININDKLRKRFGLSKKPTFKVLIKSNSRFRTEDVRTEEVKLEIANNYNEDFVEIHKTITKSLAVKESGLILLYGKPGTGKTTYIRSLISEYQESNFIFIQNEFVNNLLDPKFISFLLKQRNSILIIEDAEKVITSRGSLREESVVSTILQLTDGLFSDYLNIKVICTFNTALSKVDSALLRKGRMIAMYEFNTLSVKKTNELLRMVGGDKSNEGLTVADIYNHEKEKYSVVEKDKIGF